MRLISCHIENFGKLNDYDYEFENGCNVIRSYNGSGKSTLAAFIRVMLYGFEGENKRSAPENERKRWSPWQKGVFGGSLTFEEGGRKYVVSRTFGNKALEDTFDLRDASTNLVSSDYSEKIGEELFGVNSESYMRTAYIGQNDVITSTTDGINAKIGNIADSTSDLDCYEKASEKLTDLLNKRSPRRATGSIYKKKQEVTSLQTEVRNGSVILDSMHRLERQIEDREAQVQELLNDRGEIEAKQAKLSEYKDIQATKDIYEKIVQDVNGRIATLNERREVFPGELPLRDEIADYSAKASDLIGLSGKLDSIRLDDMENSELRIFSKKYEGLEDGENKVSSVIGQWKKREALALREINEQADMKVLSGEIENARKDARRIPLPALIGMALIVAAMILALVSVFVMPSLTLRLTGMIIAAVIMVGGVILTIIKLRSYKQLIYDDIEELSGRLEAMQNDVSADIRERNDIEAEVKRFLEKYGYIFKEKEAADNLGIIQNELRQLAVLSRKKLEYDDCLREHDELKKKINEYIARYVIRNEGALEPSDNSSLRDVLANINTNLDLYEEALRICDNAKEQKQDYEKEHDMEHILSVSMPEDMPDLAKLNQEHADIMSSIESIQADIRQLYNQRDVMQEKLDAWEENRERLAISEIELHNSEKEYRRMQLASTYLTQAKEAMTAKYMDPLLKGFARFYGSIAEDSADDYRIDANTNITAQAMGEQRDTRMLSAGYQDLIGFCMRLSLIEAMYKNDKPVIVLDDPFVNLDTNKKAAATRLLEQLATDYQLIYFTCH